MDYKRIYDNLIRKAQTRDIIGYVEKHHIIPKCIKGSNDPSNLVKLTPEEHYLAHLLLIRIHPGVKGLIYAVKMMSGQGNNKSYGWVKRRIAATGFTKEHKENLSKAQKLRAKTYKRVTTLEDMKRRWAANEIKRQLKKDNQIILALIYAVS
jgi:hypothetical protein